MGDESKQDETLAHFQSITGSSDLDECRFAVQAHPRVQRLILPPISLNLATIIHRPFICPQPSMHGWDDILCDAFPLPPTHPHPLLFHFNSSAHPSHSRPSHQTTASFSNAKTAALPMFN